MAIIKAAKQQSIKQAAAEWVPQTRAECSAAIAKIGEAQRERTRIQAALNDEIAGIKSRYEDEAHPHAQVIVQLTRGVQVWCEANRAELTNNGKTKTANLASGEVKWRMRPPSVAVRGIDAVIDALRSLGLGKFVRTREEVNKEAILAEPDAVRGVRGIKITQTEDFVVQPFETELEEIAS